MYAHELYSFIDHLNRESDKTYCGSDIAEFTHHSGASMGNRCDDFISPAYSLQYEDFRSQVGRK